MITVVHVITKLELGGAQENTLYTCQHLDRERFRVALLFGPGGMLDDTAHAMPDTRVVPIPQMVRQLHPLQDHACFSALGQQLESIRSEHLRSGHAPTDLLIHTHSSKAGFLGRLAAKRLGFPHIIHSIHSYAFHERQAPHKYRMYLEAERTAARVTDAFVSVSRANLAEGIAKGIIKHRHRAEVIRSGMDLQIYEDAQAQRAQTRASLGLDDADQVMLSIANFKPQKDPLTLLEAMARLRNTMPKAVLLYAGDGELRPEVEAAIQRFRLEKQVRLLGWRRDIPQLLAACDLVVLSSVFEGLPRSAVQAIASRRTFVGTRVDGTPEIIRDGRNGFLVEPRAPGALAEAIRKGLELRPVDPEDQVRILDWDADRMVRAQERLYQEMIDGRS